MAKKKKGQILERIALEYKPRLENTWTHSMLKLTSFAALLLAILVFANCQQVHASGVGGMARGIRACSYSALYLRAQPHVSSRCACGLVACDLPAAVTADLRQTTPSR